MAKKKRGESILNAIGTLFYNKNGQPIKRETPKVRMGKKERLKKRWQGRERFEG
jgi:hypothetical protein